MSWLERIQARRRAVRRARPAARGLRLVVASLAMAGAAGSALCSVLVAPDDRRPAVVRLGVAGVLLLGAAVIRWPSFVTPALLCLGGAAVIPAADGGAPGSIVLSAGLLVAAAELAGWAEDLRSVAPLDAGELRRRIAAIAAWCVGALLAAALVLAAARLGAPREEVAVLVGGGATLLVLSFAALRRWRDRT